MKRIIDRKVYDTDTAKCLHSWDNGIYGEDLNSMDESLYKTKKGQYFIQGCGGATTKYSEPCGNNSSSGSCRMWLVNKIEAIDWLESHDGADTILKYFKDCVSEG
ncbi:hypothetical protein KAU11_11405 [Candidatus Babeliales bacterium]|nr:hypothetical protein [Candidatus Babeliales bacterium]